MKQRPVLRRVVIILTGVLFAAYAVYQILVIVKDSSRSLSLEGKIISGLVAFLFAVLSFFAFSSAFSVTPPPNDNAYPDELPIVQNMLFLQLRSIAFSLAMVAIVALKLRMAGQVVAYLDVSQVHTLLYAVSYSMTLGGMLVLLLFFVFILPRLPYYRRLAVLLPLFALVLFLLSFIVDILLFFVFRVALEASSLRTILARPVFYLGFIGLSLYFLLPPPVTEN